MLGLNISFEKCKVTGIKIGVAKIRFKFVSEVEDVPNIDAEKMFEMQAKRNVEEFYFEEVKKSELYNEKMETLIKYAPNDLNMKGLLEHLDLLDSKESD